MNIKEFGLSKVVLAGLLTIGASAGAMAQTSTTTTTTNTTSTTNSTTTAPPTDRTLESQASSIQNFSGQLAKADLAARGITNPSPTQLSMATKSVQDMRASGMGWGQIANSLGLRLGEVVSAANRSTKAATAQSKKSETSKKSDTAKKNDTARKGQSEDHAKSGKHEQSGTGKGSDHASHSGHSSSSGSGGGHGGGGHGGGGGGGGGGGRGK